MEFKGVVPEGEEVTNDSINRIRLEFKDDHKQDGCKSLLVLIESDWNLKRDMELSTIDGAGSINRIRLEFKVH